MKRTHAGQESIVFFDTRRSVLMLHQDDDVDAYKRAVDRIVKVSLRPDISVNFIGDLRNRMENYSDI